MMYELKEYYILKSGRKFTNIQFDEDCRYLIKNNYYFKYDKAKLWIHIFLDNLDIYVIRYIDSSDSMKTKGRRFTDENTIFSVEDLLKECDE